MDCNLLTSKKSVMALLAMAMVFALGVVVIVTTAETFDHAKEVMFYLVASITGIAVGHNVSQGIADHGKPAE